MRGGFPPASRISRPVIGSGIYVVNPTTLTWTNPTFREDGTTAYTSADNLRYYLTFNDSTGAFVQDAWVDLQWGTSLTLANVDPYVALANGDYQIVIQLQAVDLTVSPIADPVYVRKA